MSNINKPGSHTHPPLAPRSSIRRRVRNTSPRSGQTPQVAKPQTPAFVTPQPTPKPTEPVLNDTFVPPTYIPEAFIPETFIPEAYPAYPTYFPADHQPSPPPVETPQAKPSFWKGLLRASPVGVAAGAAIAGLACCLTGFALPVGVALFGVAVGAVAVHIGMAFFARRKAKQEEANSTDNTPVTPNLDRFKQEQRVVPAPQPQAPFGPEEVVVPAPKPRAPATIPPWVHQDLDDSSIEGDEQDYYSPLPTPLPQENRDTVAPPPVPPKRPLSPLSPHVVHVEPLPSIGPGEAQDDVWPLPQPSLFPPRSQGYKPFDPSILNPLPVAPPSNEGSIPSSFPPPPVLPGPERTRSILRTKVGDMHSPLRFRTQYGTPRPRVLTHMFSLGSTNLDGTLMKFANAEMYAMLKKYTQGDPPFGEAFARLRDHFFVSTTLAKELDAYGNSGKIEDLEQVTNSALAAASGKDSFFTSVGVRGVGRDGKTSGHAMSLKISKNKDAYGNVQSLTFRMHNTGLGLKPENHPQKPKSLNHFQTFVDVTNINPRVLEDPAVLDTIYGYARSDGKTPTAQRIDQLYAFVRSLGTPVPAVEDAKYSKEQSIGNCGWKSLTAFVKSELWSTLKPEEAELAYQQFKAFYQSRTLERYMNAHNIVDENTVPKAQPNGRSSTKDEIYDVLRKAVERFKKTQGRLHFLSNTRHEILSVREFIQRSSASSP